jgi:hypothetical protein
MPLTIFSKGDFNLREVENAQQKSLTPSPGPGDVSTISDSRKDPKTLIWLFLLVLLLGFILHAFNMFAFPYYENDEGTYMSQAWSLVKQGALAPYKYTYDHAPGGWILIALWSVATGGFTTFGFAINSGRMLMLILHLFSSMLLYFFSLRLTGSRRASLISLLLYVVSPLGNYYHRRVLLDNIMVFWLLLSLYLALKVRPGKSQASLVVITLASAVAFGISVLTKESALVFFPAHLYLIISLEKANKREGLMRAVWWLIFALSVISLYPLMALFRGELFDSDTGVSLIKTLTEQTQRGEYNPLSLENNPFLENLALWFQFDPILISLGLLSLVVNIVLSIYSYPARIISFLAFLYLLFLIRGGVVFEFYVIPLLPWLAMSVGYLVGQLIIKGKRLEYLFYGALGIIVVLNIGYFSNNLKDGRSLFFSNQTDSQEKSVDWILANASPNSNTLIDNFAFVDLNERNTDTSRRFDYYWKADLDPEVNKSFYNSSWKNVTYIIATPQLYADVRNNPLSLTEEALENADTVERYHDDGWFVEILKTRVPAR